MEIRATQGRICRYGSQGEESNAKGFLKLLSHKV